MQIPFSCVVVLALAFGARSTAQSFGNLIGAAVDNGVPVLQQQTVCAPTSVACGPILAAPPTAFAGGAAYDPVRAVVYLSDGPSLVGVEPAVGGGACRVVCPPVPAPGLPAGAVVTGMAFAEDGSPLGSLWYADSTRNLQKCTWVNRTCPGAWLRCSIVTVIPTPAHHVGGLAISETHDAILYSASDFSGSAPDNWLLVAPLDSPCTPDCRLQVLDCFGTNLGPITGLAFDDCTSTVYATDGRVMLSTRFVPAAGGQPCRLVPIACCTAAAGRWHGLCLEPAHATVVGSSCLGTPCPSCPSLAFRAVGDPVVGNSSFGFEVTGAPAGLPAVCLLGLGACTAGLPYACGTIHLPLGVPPVSIGGLLTAGTGCDGSGFHPLPVPRAASLCGLRLSAQDFVVCPGATFGLGITNAVCFTLADS